MCVNRIGHERRASLPKFVHMQTSTWEIFMKHAGGQEPVIACPGQRRPGDTGVQTYLQRLAWVTEVAACNLKHNPWSLRECFAISACESRALFLLPKWSFSTWPCASPLLEQEEASASQHRIFIG